MKIKRKYISFCKGAVILLLFFVGAKPVKAQHITVTDTLTNAFLPAISYSSDLGLLGGGLMNRYHYRNGLRPFYSFINIAAIASTKGLFSVLFFYDKPYAFHSDLRFTSETYASRFLQTQYYGIGNYNKLQDEPPGKPNYYLFQSFTVGQEFSIREPIYYSGTGHIDVLGILELDYQTPFDNGTDRLITESKPLGYEGGRTISLGAGLIWENRDNEFRPSKGSYFLVKGQLAQKLYGSSFNYFLFEADARAFTSFFLIRKITFANRLLFQHSSGAVPYWKMSDLGGDETMRGYAENRFLDDNALVLNSELRTWLFTIPAISARFGGTLFMDVGRTFPNGESLGTVFDDLKYTFGFGGNSSFFSEDFIFRGDFGFSEEGLGVYFTAGYMF